ncbi:MAG: substrate-binding periplasmic protein [Planctomycetota bacterium]
MRMLAVLLLGLSVAVVQGAETLKLGADDWAPYTYPAKVEGKADTSKAQGFVADLARAVFKEMGISVSSFRIYPWKKALMDTYKGKLDVLMAAKKNAEREEKCYYPAEPAAASSFRFFIRAEDKGKLKYESFDDLKGHKIGLVRGFSYPAEFSAFVKKEKNFEEVVNVKQNIKKILAKKVDYMIMEGNVGAQLLKDMNQEGKLISLDKPLDSSPVYIIFSKKSVSKETADAFQKALVKFKTTDAFKSLCKQHGFEREIK